MIFAQKSYSCQDLISKYETIYEIPKGLLDSISQVESGFNPYALNHKGKSYHFSSQEQLVSKVNELIKKGESNFDLGCMQINYRWHGNKFKTWQEIIIPEKNIDYAAQLLKELYEQSGTWHQAVRFYHSQTPDHHKKYSRKVAISLARAG